MPRRLAAIVLALVSVAAPAVAEAPGVARLRVHIGGYGPQWAFFTSEDEPEGTQRGSWTASSQLEGDRLLVHVTMTPPEVNPVLSPGPAALATGVGLEYGRRNGGDIGWRQRFGFTWTQLDARAGDPCTYTADISTPLKRAQRAIAAVPDIESPVVVIGLSLVRTFGQGAWVQSLPGYDDGNGRVSHPAGSPTRIEGWFSQTPVIHAGAAQPWGQGL
jgi:hypothetical protein